MFICYWFLSVCFFWFSGWLNLVIFLLHIAQASYKKTIYFFESVKRLCRRNLSVIVLVFLNMWFCFWKKCAHLTLTVSPLACWVLNCVQFIISQVFFLALMRSVHANNLSHLGLTDTVHINAGLYGCWWNLGFLHVWVSSAPSNSTVCYKMLLPVPSSLLHACCVVEAL